MKNFDGFIFDIDGTITSTNELIFKSFNHIAEKYLNRKYTFKEITDFFGPPEDIIIKQMMGDKYPQAHKDYFEFYNNNHSSLADLYPGINEILKIIKEKNKPLGVFTGKGRKAALITLEVLEVKEYFDQIITGDDVKKHKPDPDGINIFVEKFNLEREKVLLVGDAPADIIAAHAAGIKIASVVWDSYAKEKVLELNSNYVFYTVDELKKFILDNI
jgi:HAD superfamily hydrolase (TIGR01509 family)